MLPHLLIFPLLLVLLCQIQKIIAKTKVKKLSPYFPSRSFGVSGIILKYLILTSEFL